MSTQIKRIAPLQAGKVAAILYFIFGAVFAVPFILIFSLVPSQEGAETPGVAFFVFMPFLYALLGFIFVPIVCWLYNVVAGWVGGIEIQLLETGDA
jgi:hypothetical protein